MTDSSLRPPPPAPRQSTYTESRGLPGWVKVTAIVVAIAVLLVISMVLLGSGGQAIHVPKPHG